MEISRIARHTINRQSIVLLPIFVREDLLEKSIPSTAPAVIARTTILGRLIGSNAKFGVTRMQVKNVPREIIFPNDSVNLASNTVLDYRLTHY